MNGHMATIRSATKAKRNTSKALINFLCSLFHKRSQNGNLTEEQSVMDSFMFKGGTGMHLNP